jgi:hypothetical protein
MRLEIVHERRSKTRFGIRRELRYKLLENSRIVGTGEGYTVDICSGGVAFQADRPLSPGGFVELSISWPVLLDESCPMRLSVFGRVLRCEGLRVVCTVDKYEFRTQARTFQQPVSIRHDSMLQRWAETIRREDLKATAGA